MFFFEVAFSVIFFYLSHSNIFRNVLDKKKTVQFLPTRQFVEHKRCLRCWVRPQIAFEIIASKHSAQITSTIKQSAALRPHWNFTNYLPTSRRSFKYNVTDKSSETTAAVVLTDMGDCNQTTL